MGFRAKGISSIISRATVAECFGCSSCFGIPGPETLCVRLNTQASLADPELLLIGVSAVLLSSKALYATMGIFSIRRWGIYTLGGGDLEALRCGP